MPARMARGKIVRLELENFKSYKGLQTIGPFYDFTAIIGPNGAGKSNLMDAISFVLGVRTGQLRGSQLKDLIYAFDDKEKEQRGRRAFVRLVYQLGNESELQFTRIITSSGGSDYRIDGVSVTWDEYNSRLKSLDILVKARNFLVFQGDVESIASKNPKELTGLLEQISGSDDLKRDYEKFEEEKGIAEEKSALVYQKKRTIVSERKQKKEQKEEAEKHLRLQEELKSLKRDYFLWQLFNIENDFTKASEELDAEKKSREEVMQELENFELDKNPPPSPPSYPIIGHLHLLTNQPIHRALQKLSTQYGDVFSLQFGSRHVAIISSPSAVEECFTKNDIVLANRPLLIMGKHVGYNYTNIVNAPYGHHWRNLRRIATVEILSSTRLNLFLDIRKDEILRLLRQFSGAGGGWSRVELRSKLTEMSFNIIMRMMAGKRYYGDDVAEEARRFREVMKEVLENAGAENPADFLPVLKWIPINNYEKRVERLGKKADLFLQGLIEEHRNRKDGGDRNTVIDHLLTLQESQPEYYSDQIIKGFVLDIEMDRE